MEKLIETTGLKTFKSQRLEIISKQILSKITKLQNPPKEFCNKIPKLICKLDIGAGFASGIHEILWCLVSAYYKNQTVILIPDWGLYFDRGANSWDTIFMPLSTTCDHKHLPKDQLNIERLPNNVTNRKLMSALPKEFGAELMALVDSPTSWFQSQFTGYIMRPQPRLEKFIKDFKEQNNFTHPIVGIHVRRSDKLVYHEALYYPVSDYMMHVKDFYDKLDLNNKTNERRVYVASDDPKALDELRRKYPEYIFIGSIESAKLAQSARYSTSSLWAVLTDVFLLSQTDHIVCTFSSAICRLSYELMRFKQKDSSFQYRSLDVPFAFHFALTPVRTAFYNHFSLSDDQWNITIGDHFHERIKIEQGQKNGWSEWFDQAINGRGWDSYFFASNSSVERFYKLYPNYKVYDDIELI